MSRTFVIGDIHGCLDELNAMLDAIAPEAADALVFLGDYIDRGPTPAGVVERLVRLRREGPQCVFLRGNHEDMFLDFLGLGGHYGEAFLFNGGAATLRSYGCEGEMGGDVAARLPPEHLDFLRQLSLHHTVGEFLCVHAGIHPLLDWDDQVAEDLLWIREEFIRNPHPLGKTILFGHTPQREVFIDLPYKLGLDTGVVYGNKLSAFELNEMQLVQVPAGGRSPRRHSLAAEFERVRRAE